MSAISDVISSAYIIYYAVVIVSLKSHAGPTFNTAPCRIGDRRVLLGTVMLFAQVKRQARKLNFLITQTELYAHFMAKKITGASEEDKAQILNRMDEREGLKLHNAVLDDYGTTPRGFILLEDC